MWKWIIGLFILDNTFVEEEEEDVSLLWHVGSGCQGVVRVGCFLLLLVVLIGVIYGLRQ